LSDGRPRKQFFSVAPFCDAVTWVMRNDNFMAERNSRAINFSCHFVKGRDGADAEVSVQGFNTKKRSLLCNDVLWGT